jgi:hypothetical protein
VSVCLIVFIGPVPSFMAEKTPSNFLTILRKKSAFQLVPLFNYPAFFPTFWATFRTFAPNFALPLRHSTLSATHEVTIQINNTTPLHVACRYLRFKSTPKLPSFSIRPRRNILSTPHPRGSIVCNPVNSYKALVDRGECLYPACLRRSFFFPNLPFYCGHHWILSPRRLMTLLRPFRALGHMKLHPLTRFGLPSLFHLVANQSKPFESFRLHEVPKAISEHRQSKYEDYSLTILPAH